MLCVTTSVKSSPKQCCTSSFCNFPISKHSSHTRRRSLGATTRPLRVEKHLSSLILKSRQYHSSGNFLENTNNMEETVSSLSDGTQLFTVQFSPHSKTLPICFSYSPNEDGYRFYHGIAFICDNYGSLSNHNYTSKRHLTSSFQTHYKDVHFNLPTP